MAWRTFMVVVSAGLVGIALYHHNMFAAAAWGCVLLHDLSDFFEALTKRAA